MFYFHFRQSFSPEKNLIHLCCKDMHVIHSSFFPFHPPTFKSRDACSNVMMKDLAVEHEFVVVIEIGFLPILLDVEGPFELEVSVVIIINELGDSVVMATH